MERQHHNHRQTVSRTSADRRVWSPAQLVAGAVGVALVVMGGVALARTGADSLTGEVVTVGGFGHTTLMGLIDVVAGLLFLGSAGSATAVRAGLTGLALAALAFGAVVAIEPGTFETTLGSGRPLGLLYALIGVVSLVAAWASPLIVVDRRAGEDVVAADEELHDTDGR
jgi:hypothetical protein